MRIEELQLPHLAARVFNTPLMIEPEKADIIVAALGPRFGITAHRPPMAFGRDRDRFPFDVVEGVAMIDVHGTLVQRATGMDAMSGLTSYEQLSGELKQAVESDAVKGIILDIDSPGGEVKGVFDLADQIAAAREIKPVHAVVTGNGASAAYLLASAASKVVVSQSSMTGSIGVIAKRLDTSKAEAEAGVTVTEIFAGKRKADTSPHHPLKDEERQAIQANIDEAYDLFVGSVARFRGMDEQAIRNTEAAIYVGAKAVDTGLADEVGAIDDAFAALAEQVAQTPTGGGFVAQVEKQPGGHEAAATMEEQPTMTQEEMEKQLAEYKAKAEKAEERAGKAEADAYEAKVDALIKASRDKIAPAMKDSVKKYAEKVQDIGEVEAFINTMQPTTREEPVSASAEKPQDEAEVDDAGAEEVDPQIKELSGRVFNTTASAILKFQDVVAWHSDGKLAMRDGSFARYDEKTGALERVEEVA